MLTGASLASPPSARVHRRNLHHNFHHPPASSTVPPSTLSSTACPTTNSLKRLHDTSKEQRQGEVMVRMMANAPISTFTNTSIRVKTSPASAGLAVLPAVVETTRTRRAIRRTSPSTNRHHSPPPASAARRRSRLVPTPPPNCPPSTRPRDANCDTCGCSECTTICCWKKSLWRIRSG